MKIYQHDITFSEISTEICLTFFVSGCNLHCPGCSWQNTELTPVKLTPTYYAELLHKYQGKATCVCFLGGEWDLALVDYLRLANKLGYKTCLYTGLSMTEFRGMGVSDVGVSETGVCEVNYGKDANASHTDASETMNYRTEIYEELDYIKTGKWIQLLGGLDSETTNQSLLNIKQKLVITGKGSK